MYAIDRRHKKIASDNTEFQHHGIFGQKWGVITKNVGVNYVPVGDKKSGNTDNGPKGIIKGKHTKPAKPSATSRTMDSDGVINYIKAITKNGEYNNVPNKMFSKVTNDERVKNAPNDKEACKNARAIIQEAVLNQFFDKDNYFWANGIDPWQSTAFENIRLPGQTMSYKEAEYNWYIKGSVDITDKLGYNFTGNNTPKIAIGVYNGIPMGQFGFYKNKMYDNVDKMIKEYNKDINKNRA